MADLNLIIPSFIAGLLTFLAPCTLPLVPGFLAFISGVSLKDLNNPEQAKKVRVKIFLNGLLYVLGFSAVFIILGSLFGLGGAALIQYRLWLSRIGGIFVIIFGLFMIRVLDVPFLNLEKKLSAARALKPGTPLSSFIFGATFAFGWTPCVGPVLGSVLLLASTSATVLQGAFLLMVFSLGLAVPFLLIASTVGSASRSLNKLGRHLNWLTVVGGLFLVLLGVLLVTGSYNGWIGFMYRLFDFINYDRLLDYL